MSTLADQRLARLYELRERLRAVNAQESLHRASLYKKPNDLAEIIFTRNKTSPALELLDEHLVAVWERRIDRLAWSMPPQEGKSFRIARTFPLWVLLKNPDTRIVIASFQFGMASRWGRVIRNDIEEHPELGLKVRKDRRAAHDWQLDGFEGGILCVGIGGSLTGRPADLLIIDDPVKDHAEADSEVMRERAWEWWTGAASSRLGPDAPVIIDMTRWHEDDLMGRMLLDQPERWAYVNIPAIADHDPNRGETDVLGREPGQWMQSVRGRTDEQWEKRRLDAGSRTWQALYQGRPSPADGGIFKRHWWQIYDLPRAIQRDDGTWQVLGAKQVITSWDMTFKDTKGSDYVVGQVWARNGTNLWLVDQVRGRWDFTETCMQVELLHYKWPQSHLILVEDKANGPAVLSQLSSRVPGMVPVTPVDSKLARASAIAPFVEAGNVFLPSPELAPWVGDFLEEVAVFPNGSHDDQVDAMSQALSRLMLGASDSSSFMDELLKEKGLG